MSLNGDQRGKLTGDGRFVDTALGVLQGEGSQQVVEAEDPHPDHTLHDVWSKLPSQSEQAPEGPTYYDRPVIKEPVWIWSVAIYFYLGGAAGVAAVLGAVAQLLGGRHLQGLVKRCHWIAALGFNIGAFFLIYDLGRKERFLHMLRVFRITSPMSIGSWLLAIAGGLTGLSAALVNTRGFLKQISKLALYAASLPSLIVAGYTAVLITNTAVPLWQAVGRSLPLLFMSSSMASVAALLEPLSLNRREQKVVQRFGAVSKAAELAAMFVVEKEALRVERVGRPLRQGSAGILWQAAKLCSAAGLLLSLFAGRSRAWRIGAALLTTVGALALRFGMMQAGRASARDPQATFQQQRAGQGAAAVTGPAGQRALAR